MKVGANEAFKRGFEKEFQKGNFPHESNLDFVQLYQQGENGGGMSDGSFQSLALCFYIYLILVNSFFFGAK